VIEGMFTFTDLNGNGVELSFKKNAFNMAPKHVLVLAKYHEQWLLTDHPKRGLEFPGGKVEGEETLEQAAEREVYEETGAIIHEIEWLATYYVHDECPFSKAVYVANVLKIDDIQRKFETNGAVLLSDEELHNSDRLSFYMKDAGMKKMLEKVSEREDKWLR
jgi:8-oxo-dGTP diphosphatase